MSRRLVAGLVALVAIGGVVAFGLSKQGDVSRIDTTNVTVPPAGFQTFAAAGIKGTTFDGSVFSLVRLKGKPVFINFWGSWCEPCRREAPELRAFSRTLGGRAVFVGVAVQSPHKEAVAFARKAGWRYPIVSTLCCDLSNRYGVVYMPTTIVVDSRGQVVDRLIGPQTAARLTAEMRALGA
jgi:thiol-disulfide isomerase/thioredoxin